MKKKKENPNYYTYYFTDGTKNTVTAAKVGQDWIDRLYALDEEERKKNYNYSRHNYPLSQVDYEGETFVDVKADPHEKLLCNLEQERIDSAVATLSKRQREVFELYYYEKKKQVEIADELGITQQAVAAIYERAEKKMQKFFGEPVVF